MRVELARFLEKGENLVLEEQGLASRHGEIVEPGAGGVLALELRGDVAPVGAVVLVVHLVGVEAEVAVAVARQRHEERLGVLARATGQACGGYPPPPETCGAVLAVTSGPGGNLVAPAARRGLPLLKRQAELGHVVLEVGAHLVECRNVLAHVHSESPPPIWVLARIVLALPVVFHSLNSHSKCNASPWKTSQGVRQPRRLRGLRLIASHTPATSSSATAEKPVPLGKYPLIRPLAFSAVPFSQGWWARRRSRTPPPSPR